MSTIEVQKLLENLPTKVAPGHDLITGDILKYLLKKAAVMLEAPGHDLITGEIIKHLPRKAVVMLTQTTNAQTRIMIHPMESGRDNTYSVSQNVDALVIHMRRFRIKKKEPCVEEQKGVRLSKEATDITSMACSPSFLLSSVKAVASKEENTESTRPLVHPSSSSLTAFMTLFLDILLFFHFPCCSVHSKSCSSPRVFL